jgi:hypothetical protein
MAPEIGELEEPLPMVIFAISATICGIFSLIIYIHDKYRLKNDKEQPETKKFKNEGSLKNCY